MKKLIIVVIMIMMASMVFAAEVEKVEDEIMYVTGTDSNWCFFIVVDDETYAFGNVIDGKVPIVKNCTIYVELPPAHGKGENIIVEIENWEVKCGD